jgi:integrase
MNTDGVAPIPFVEFREKILDLYAPPQRAPNTFKGMRRLLDRVGELIGDGTTADLTTALVARFIATRPAGQSAHTTIGQLGYLGAACSIAAAEGWVRISPFQIRKRWIKRPKVKGKKHHSREEIARVLDLMRRDIGRKKGWARWRAWRLYALASTVAFTGLRRNEALRLKVEDVDLAGRMILVVAREGSVLKTEGSAQPVPMPEALAQVLAQWLPHSGGEWAFPNAVGDGPWIGGSPGYKPLDRMKRLGKRAGVEGFTFVSLRHSWATHAEFWGLTDAQIARVLRHTTPRTAIENYRHPDAVNLRLMVQGIGFGQAPPAESPSSPPPGPSAEGPSAEGPRP